MNGPKMEGSKPIFNGKDIGHQDEGLVLYPTDDPGSRSAGNNENEPTYTDTSMRTGSYGSNPWREK